MPRRSNSVVRGSSPMARRCYVTIRPLPSGRRRGIIAAHLSRKEHAMPRGDKSKYTDKQERKAEHIEEGYEKRGVPEKEAKRRAWATVNKIHKGGERPGGGGFGRPEARSPNRKGGRRGGAAAASRSKSARSASARKAAATRKARGR